MRQTVTRTEYCRKQAEDCAAAAAATPLTDVKEAYLNLEQAWLQLAPELGESVNSATSAVSSARTHVPDRQVQK
jgi:hypothetical protein